MAIHEVCQSVIKLGPTSELIGELVGYSVQQQAQRKDRTVLGTCQKSWGSGPRAYTGTVVAFYDPSDVGQVLIVLGGSDQQMIIEVGSDSGDPIITSPETGFTGADIDASDRDGDVRVTFTWHANAGLQVTAQP